jgi:hypothetical protein
MSIFLIPISSDNFHYANISPLPAPWILTQGTDNTPLAVVSNLCQGSAPFGLNIELFNYAGEGGTPSDQYASGTVATLINGASLFVGIRVTDIGGDEWLANPGYYFRVVSNGAWSLFAEGTTIAFGSGLIINAGDVFTIAAIGTTIYAFQNSTQLASVTDASYASGIPMLQIAPAAVTDGQVSNFVIGRASNTPPPPPPPSSASFAGYAPSWAAGENVASRNLYISAGSINGGMSTIFDGAIFSVAANSTTYFWTDSSGVVQSGPALPASVYAIAKVVSGNVTTGTAGQTAPGILSITDLRGSNG